MPTIREQTERDYNNLLFSIHTDHIILSPIESGRIANSEPHTIAAEDLYNQLQEMRNRRPIMPDSNRATTFPTFLFAAEETAPVDPDIIYCCHYNCMNIVEDDEPAFTENDNGPYCARHYEIACQEERDEDYNEDDEDDDASIYSYSYKPNPVFRSLDKPNGSTKHNKLNFGDPLPLMMGFELEVEAGDADRTGCARSLKGKLEGIGFLKSDASLRYGFEIVTHPATLGWYMEKFPWAAISGLAKKGFTAWNSSSCGLHIHVSRAAFEVNMEERNIDLAIKREFTAIDDKHMWRFIYFIYKNKKEMIQFAGRNSTNYASYDLGHLLGTPDYDRFDEGRQEYAPNPNYAKEKRTLMGLIKGKSDPNGRSVAANMLNEHTIELRLFRPSLNPTTVKACLQFCEALFQYTKGLTIKEIMQEKALEFKAFHSYVMVNNVLYPDLVRVIARRVFPDRTRNA